MIGEHDGDAGGVGMREILSKCQKKSSAEAEPLINLLIPADTDPGCHQEVNWLLSYRNRSVLRCKGNRESERDHPGKD